MPDLERVDSVRSLNLLAELVLHNTAQREGTAPAAIRGLDFHRFSSPCDPVPHFLQPVIIVVAQGRKVMHISGRDYVCAGNTCFVSGVNMPLTSWVLEASEEQPYLAMSLSLDMELLAELSVRTPPVAAHADCTCGAMIQEMSPELLDAFVRLADLTTRPDDIAVMGDIMLREVHYRLLRSPIGELLRSFNAFGTQGHQISRAIHWLEAHYMEPLSVEELAARSSMAPSTFHRHFKKVTSVSPLQYQKRLRLDKAHHLMMSATCDVTQAAYAVGYESVSQFIREYRRLYGSAPRKNILALQTAGQKASASFA